MLFTVPIERVPSSFVRQTPPSLPVIYQDEHVATAILRDETYSVHIFYGDIQKGLTAGKLFLKPRYIDDMHPGQLNSRRYVAVEIIPREFTDLS